VASIASAAELGARDGTRESQLWSVRMLAVIPAMMFIAAILGIDCFFRDPP
jgi:hypothetical protein